MLSIQPCLMFKDQAQEAVEFYTSIIPDSEIVETAYYTQKELDLAAAKGIKDMPGPAGQVKTILFTLKGQPFLACNGGAFFEFNFGISLYLRCESEDELDEIYEKLADGGHIEDCGWVRDRFNVPWQVVPAFLERALADSDPETVDRLVSLVQQSKKLDYAALERARAGH